MYEYIYNATGLSQMTVGNDTLRFFYDASGLPVSVNYNGTTYYYTTNMQGDVTAILNTAGTAVVEYTYDAWGVPLTITGSDSNTLGILNPLRYRGYVYDQETGLYYLQSRYYNPAIGRFLNADALVSTGQEHIGNNMFTYCGNNPVCRSDDGGLFWDFVFDVVSLCVSVVEVVKNPDDPMAWLGLAADVASVAVPCVSGGGALVRAATKADDVVDTLKIANKADNVIDAGQAVSKTKNTIETATTASQGWKVGDDISALTRAGNTPSWSTVRQRYWKNEAYYNPELWDGSLDLLRKGKAPIGKDGFPMELHHVYGREGDAFFNVIPMTRTDHIKFHQKYGYKDWWK